MCENNNDIPGRGEFMIKYRIIDEITQCLRTENQTGPINYREIPEECAYTIL